MPPVRAAHVRPLRRRSRGSGGGSPDGRRRRPLRTGVAVGAAGDDNGAVRSIGGRLLVASVIAAVLLPGCAIKWGTPSAGDAGRTARPGTVTVASFDFDESRVLAELYAQALEDRGLTVERAIGVGSREVLEPALEQGRVDVVPEYSGTALEFLNRSASQASADADATYAQLQRALGARGLVALQRADAENQNAVAVTRATADKLGLRTISDLSARAPGLVFGGPPECPTRPLCLAGLKRTYGLDFKRFRPLDAAGPYTLGALRDGTIDAALLFTTTAAVAEGDVVLLVDDRQLQPSERVVPVVRAAALAHHPEIAATLDAVSAKLTTAELITLNGVVEGGGNPAVAARSWLIGHDLLHHVGRPKA
jgi:osmoprotectant transport system substrate-binding protein